MNRLSVWGKIARKGRGKGGGGGRACRQTFEAAINIPPSCNYPADHLSVRSLSVNQFRAWVTPGKINRKWAVFCSVWKQSEMEHEPYCRFCKKSLISGKRINKPIVLLVRFVILKAAAMSELGMRKVQILSWLLQNVNLRRQVQKRSAALRSPTGITPLGIYPVFIAIKGGGRPTRRLPHAKMLLVPISFFPLLGRLCSGRFYIFTEQMWF